jgi:hypothetical protein
MNSEHPPIWELFDYSNNAVESCLRDATENVAVDVQLLPSG